MSKNDGRLEQLGLVRKTPDFDRLSRRGQTYIEKFEELKQFPGEWFVVKTAVTGNAAKAAASNMRRGKITLADPGDGSYEIVAQDLEVFARFVAKE